jgi:hypothetical protein
MAARGRVNQASRSFRWRLAVRERSDDDALDVAGHLGGESIEWSGNWDDLTMRTVQGGTAMSLTAESSTRTWQRVRAPEVTLLVVLDSSTVDLWI